MYCSACKLQFPDNLNFCKQCGRPLVVQPEDSATLSKCCTRCGARVVAGENFCQQCGARAHTKTQDTTIGACQQCSTPWRSAWLYCRNCGLDRDRALQLSAVPALPQQSTPTLTTEVVSLSSKTGESALLCPRCNAEATPYAQFCDVCGQSLSSRRIEPIAVDEDGEVHLNTLEVPAAPATPQPITELVSDDDVAVAEDEVDSSRTTERVLALQSAQPDTNPMARPEAYSTQETKPVNITELYYEEDEAEPQADSEIEASESEDFAEPLEDGPTHRTTSFEPRRSTSDVRMTVESRAIRTKDIEEVVDEDLDEVDVDYTTPTPKSLHSPGSAPVPGTSSPRQATWQVAAIIVCLLVLFTLIGIIASNEISRRYRGPDARVTPTPLAANTTASPASPSTTVAPEGMVYIPGGTLRMGRENGDRFERPAHSVTVAPFSIDRTEVTNQQYQKFITETGHAPPSHWQNGSYPEGEAEFPVVNVSWQDANDYAKWAGKRLPTEAEWEFAARGTEARLYPWGSKWETGRANIREGGRGRVAAVGTYRQGASQFGVLDLSGNVWEWTSDELTSYSDPAEVLAPGRVIRGGAWDVPSDRATATYRGVVQPERAYDKTGFRCAK